MWELQAAALAASGAALAATPAQAGYNFEIINDPNDKPFPPPLATGGVTFTNLMGIYSNGDTIPGSLRQWPRRRSQHGICALVTQRTFTSSNATFPGLVPPVNAAQTQMTAINGNGTTFTGYNVPDKQRGVATGASSSASTSRAGCSTWSTTRRPPTAVSRATAIQG